MAYRLVIDIDDQGQLNVNGPIGNKLVAFGMLELAKDAVREFNQQAQQRVVPVTPADMAALGDGVQN